MHGLIFVTWEGFLAENFGSTFLNTYRAAIGETPQTAPLATRIYDDATLLAGVGAACQLTKLSVDVMLRRYGQYFIMNGLTSYRCAYLLNQVSSGRDLLLMMRKAHGQMRLSPDAMTPPLFEYEVISSTSPKFTIVYESERKLCSLLVGAIEGAAMRYGEQVQLVERSCMKNGSAACRFEVLFSKSSQQLEIPQQEERRKQKQLFSNQVLAVLPLSNGYTLLEVQQIMQRQGKTSSEYLRPSFILEALQSLLHAGMVASTGSAGDSMNIRRYWRLPLQ